jgi:hypothetical protein
MIQRVVGTGVSVRAPERSEGVRVRDQAGGGIKGRRARMMGDKE